MMPRVKEVTAADGELLTQIAAIEAQVFTDAWSLASIRSSAESPATRIYAAVTETDRVAGYCIVTQVLDTADLENIAVAPEFRRQGIAARLLDAAFAGMDADIHLEVRASNAGAIALYRKYGFTECGIRRRYYENPREDAILMLKSRKEENE